MACETHHTDEETEPPLFILQIHPVSLRTSGWELGVTAENNPGWILVFRSWWGEANLTGSGME